MKRALIVFLALYSQQVLGQLVLLTDSHDFETLLRADDNWVDFKVENRTTQAAHLFRMEVPKNVQVLFSTKLIQPDSTAIVRVSYSPMVEGVFKEKLKLFASAWNEPAEITIKGTATFVANNLIPCPNFDDPKTSRTMDFHVSVRAENNEKLNHPVSIVVYKSGVAIAEKKVDKNGETVFQLEYGRYLISARDDVSVIDSALYVNASNDHLLMHMANTPNAEIPLADKPENEYEKVPRPEEMITNVEEQVVSIPDWPKEEINPEKENAHLPPSLYRQNNLVFLVDVSTSMKKNGKLDLLKVAMIDLLAVLRPNDRFALISYSSETNTIIQTEENLDREACKAAIQALTAGGSTEGARAIDVAGKMAVNHFVEDGNNQVFLATDGAFNEATDKAKKIVAKYNRRDVKLSVLGIKCGPFTTKQMTELAELGGGRFLPIKDSSGAGQKLLDEVKRSALK